MIYIPYIQLPGSFAYIYIYMLMMIYQMIYVLYIKLPGSTHPDCDEHQAKFWVEPGFGLRV